MGNVQESALFQKSPMQPSFYKSITIKGVYVLTNANFV